MLTDIDHSNSGSDHAVPKSRWQKEPRPHNYHDIGVKGRKTGITAPSKVQTDEYGLMNVEDWFPQEEEEEIEAEATEPVGVTKATKGYVPYPSSDDEEEESDIGEHSLSMSPTEPRNTSSRLRPSLLGSSIAGQRTPSVGPDRFSNISNLSIVDEDIPSPRSVLNPAKPLIFDRLESIGPATTTHRARRDNGRASGSFSAQLPARARDIMIEVCKTTRKSRGTLPLSSLSKSPSLSAPLGEYVDYTGALKDMRDFDDNNPFRQKSQKPKTPQEQHGKINARTSTLSSDDKARAKKRKASNVAFDVERFSSSKSAKRQQKEADTVGTFPTYCSKEGSGAELANRKDDTLSLKKNRSALEAPSLAVRPEVLEQSPTIMRGHFTVGSRGTRNVNTTISVERVRSTSEEVAASSDEALRDVVSRSPSLIDQGNSESMDTVVEYRIPPDTTKERTTLDLMDEANATARETDAQRKSIVVNESSSSARQQSSTADSEPDEYSDVSEPVPANRKGKGPAKQPAKSKRKGKRGKAKSPPKEVAESDDDDNRRVHGSRDSFPTQMDLDHRNDQTEEHHPESSNSAAIGDKIRTKKEPTTLTLIRHELPPEVTEAVLQLDNNNEEENGNRRSTRMRMKPLKFWAGERVVVGRRTSGFFPVPVVKEVIRVDSDEEAKSQAKSRASASRVKKETPLVRPDIPVINILTGEEEDQRIVNTPEMLNPRIVGAGDYRFQKLFSEGEYIAAGVLVIPKGAQKPNKKTDQSTMIFCVISGEVEVQVHKTVFVVKTGSQFFVPRGNQYRITNVGFKEAKLFFCHGKEIVVQANEGDA